MRRLETKGEGALGRVEEYYYVVLRRLLRNELVADYYVGWLTMALREFPPAPAHDLPSEIAQLPGGRHG